MSPKRSSKGNALGTIFAVILVLFLGGYYLISETDPLGLFGTATPAPATAIAEVLPTKTLKPTKTPKATATTSSPKPSNPTETSAPAVPPTAEPAQPATEVPTVTTAPSNPASWWQVYFVTSQRVRQAQEEEYGAKGLPAELLKGSITAALIAKIDAAQKTIHIASFETDIIDVANALIRAKERGVDVRWITDDESGLMADTKPGHGQFALMKKAGIPVIDDKRGALMHDKFWLFDGQTVWSGSTNVTISGMFEQNNNVIVIESAELAAIYERQFEDMWAGKFNAKAPSTVDQQKVTIDGTPIQILFSPEDKAISKIIPYVQGAQKSVRFMAFTFTQPLLSQAMIEAAKRGVAVSGVFETTGADSQYGAMTPLACAKVPVRIDGNYSFMHHKVIVIDNRIVITGSLNFTDNADQSNNENVLIIDNPEIAKLYTAEFERVWAAGKDQDPTKITCK
jgi:phosphatidylserine/phosphatidylglycerophosphate/cardiolipin synthase-like enzyme